MGDSPKPLCSGGLFEALRDDRSQVPGSAGGDEMA